MSYIIDRTNYLFSPNDSPYKNARLVEVHEPFERQLSKGVTEKGSRCISSSRCFVFSHVFFSGLGSCMHFPYFSGYSEYPIGIEIYDDYRE